MDVVALVVLQHVRSVSITRTRLAHAHPPLLPPSTRTCPGVDPCCFHGRGRHEQILAYNAAAQGVLQWGGEHGWFTTAIVDWNVHEYSPRDRAVITAAWAATRVNANHSAYDTLPCDILRAAKVPCHA